MYLAWRMTRKITVSEARKILGARASTMTDKQVQIVLNGMYTLAIKGIKKSITLKTP